MHIYKQIYLHLDINAIGKLLFFFFFLKFLADTLVLFGPVVRLFWISGDVSSGFQSQSGFCLICIAEANVMHIP